MSTQYVVVFVTIMTVVVALSLTLLYTGWKDASKQNEAIFNKRAVIASVTDHLPLEKRQTVDALSDEQIQEIFDTKVDQVVVNMNGEVVDAQEVSARGYGEGRAEDVDTAKEKKRPEEERFHPVFIYNEGGKKYYILAVRGNGLWDEIWGNIAIEGADYNTIAGATFDHKGETPGLGAEIKDNPAFSAQFKGKKIYNDSGKYVSVNVRKGGAKDQTHDVDGISGATVTADGVSEMLWRGLQYYEPYLKSVQSGKPAPSLQGMLAE